MKYELPKKIKQKNIILKKMEMHEITFIAVPLFICFRFYHTMLNKINLAVIVVIILLVTLYLFLGTMVPGQKNIYSIKNMIMQLINYKTRKEYDFMDSNKITRESVIKEQKRLEKKKNSEKKKEKLKEQANEKN